MQKNAHSNANEDKTAEQIAEQTVEQIAVRNATTRRAHELRIGKEIKICGKIKIFWNEIFHGNSSLTVKLCECSVESAETPRGSHHYSCRFASQALRLQDAYKPEKQK